MLPFPLANKYRGHPGFRNNQTEHFLPFRFYRLPERDQGFPLADIQFSDLAKYNGKLYAGGGFVGDSGNSGLFVTTDNGITWNDVPLPANNPNGIDSMVANGDTFYVASSSNIYITKNGGITYNRTNFSNGATITSMTQHNDIVYATSSNGRYFKTDNEGVNWQTVQNPQTPSFVNSLHFNGDQVFMAAWDGIYRSIDDGIGWSEINDGIRSLDIEALTADDDFLYAGTSGQGMFRSGDNGASWEKINNGIDSSGGYFIQDIIITESALYIGTEYGLYFSTDQGITWNRNEVPREFELAGRLARDGEVFVGFGYEGRIFVSRDMAQTWEVASTEGLPPYRGYNSVDVKGDTIVIGSFEDNVFISENLGASWKAIPFSMEYTFIYNLRFVDDALYAATSNGLFVTRDFGTNWSRLLNYDTEMVQDFVIDGEMVYAATGNGVQVGEAGGDDWHPHNEGMYTRSAQRLLQHDGQLFVGTFHASIWSINAKEITLPPLDDDGDGVVNAEDFCPNTAVGATVDPKGCETVSNDVIYVRSISTTCPNTANGTIEIVADLQNYRMDVLIAGNNYEQKFTKILASEGLIIENLAPGKYYLTISLPDVSYERKFMAEISGIASIIADQKTANEADKTAVYKVSGSTKYAVTVNGKTKNFHFTSINSNEILLENLEGLNTISIMGERECQGKIEDELVLSKSAYVYPTISNEKVSIVNAKGEVEITLFNLHGQLVLARKFHNADDHEISLANLKSGIYLLQTKTGNKVDTVKIVKP